jgi:uncharacterized membrane protein HdeD (DUF308 family)
MDRIESRVSTLLERGWRFLLIRGIAAIAFGVLTWAKPGISLAALVLVFGTYAFLDGVLAVWASVAAHAEGSSWMLLLGGIVGIGIGVLAFSHPETTAFALLVYLAIWAIGTGVFEILAAIRIRREVRGEWRLILAGIVSVAFGAFLMIRPTAGALSVLWLIAAYATTFGIILVMLALKARELSHQLARP